VSRLLAEHDVLTRLSRVLGPAHDLQLTVEAVLGAMRELIDFRGGSICLAEHGYVRMVACDPQASAEVLGARVPIGSGIAGRIVADGVTIYVPDLDADDRVNPGLRALGSNAGMRSFLGVPLVFLGETIGVLQIDSTATNAFDRDDVHALEWLATHVSGAIGSAAAFERSRDLERLKNDFIQRVSHELRTPLTVIKGFVETLVAGTLRPEHAEDALARIASHTARLEYLIEDLLDLTSMEAGASRPTLVETRLADVLPDDCVIDGELVVRTNGGLLARAVNELVANACTFGGGATVRAYADVPGWVVVDVADGGPGIPPDIVDHAGERFVRGPGTNPGLGLGLYRVQRIADALAARFTLETNSTGTTARLHLPT